MKGHDRYRPKETPDVIVKGARLILALFVGFWVLIAALVWFAFGAPLPDWHLPQQEQEQEQAPTP